MRPTRFSESRKQSVPGRVHSVFKIRGSGAAPAAPVQPLVDSRRGRIASKFIFTAFFLCWSGRAGASNQSGGLEANPFNGLPPLSPNLFLEAREHPAPVVGGVLAHHVPGRLGQLAGQRLGRHDPVDLRLFPVVELPAGGVMALGEVGGLDEGPGQIFVAALFVVLPLLLAVGRLSPA